MAYRHDPDLEFLAKCSSEDLDDLVSLLVYDPKDKKKRVSESLSSKEDYKRYYPEHNKYWKYIVEEIQHYGGNTIANAVRGEGVLYKEILCDVCDKIKVNYNSNSSVERIEQNLLSKILEDALEKMKPDEIKELATSLGLKNTDSITKQVLLGSFQAIFKLGGFKSYQLTLVVVNTILKALIGRGLALAGNAALMRAMTALAGPIGWVITVGWTAVDIAGAAYRVTIPAVIQIAALRQKVLYANTAHEIEFK